MAKKVTLALIFLALLLIGYVSYQKLLGIINSPFLIMVTAPSVDPILNVTPLTMYVRVEFSSDGYGDVSTNYSYLMLLIKVSPNVLNVSAFKLSRDIYLIPPYEIENDTTTLSFQMRNGSVIRVELDIIRNVPKNPIRIMIDYNVQKRGAYYFVRPISWPHKSFDVWNRTFNVTLMYEKPIKLAYTPQITFKNDTYILPDICGVMKGNTTLIPYHYLIGGLYIVGPAGSGIVGGIYFPCTKMDKLFGGNAN